MRTARIKADGAGYYHCMSRIIERRMILGDLEKERLLDLMLNLAAFGGLEILTYAFMSNHFHILVHVPENHEITDEELFRRLRFIYSALAVAMIRTQLLAYRREGNDSAATSLRNRYTYALTEHKRSAACWVRPTFLRIRAKGCSSVGLRLGEPRCTCAGYLRVSTSPHFPR